MSPVPGVPDVPSVPQKKGDNTDNRDRKDRGQHPLTSVSGFLEGKSEKERYAILLYDHPEGLTYQAAASLLNIHPDTIKRYGSRLNEKQGAEWLQPIGTGSPQQYTLTILGRAEIQKKYFDYQRSIAEQQRQALLVTESTMKYDSGMELPDQIEKFREFFELHQEYMEQLLAQLRAGNAWFNVAFDDLARFSPELADILLERPEEVLKAWQIAIEKMDLPRSSEEMPRMNARVNRLRETIRLSSLGPEHINRLVQVEAQVLTVSERRPQMTSARFECPSCGNVLHVLQADTKFREPSRCGCGRKGKFKMLSKELVPACSLLLVQPLTELVGKKVRPSQLKVFLKNDLTRDEVRDHLGLNSMVRIVGVLHEVPIILREGGQSTRFDLALEAVSVELLDHYNPHLALSPERIEQIKTEVTMPGFKKRMIESFFPQHIGDESLKLQLLCMSVAMPLHLNTPDLVRQADCESLHIIVAGDPGMGKSSLGNRVLELCPHGGRATGPGASKAGLTIAADSKDKENDLVIPQPGALPSANMGIFLLDELDKMDQTEQTVLNTALSEHTLTITKRGANTTLPARVCFIGFANPRVKTWDLSKRTIQDEVNIHYSLLTRCIINVQADLADEDKDKRIASAILHKGQRVITAFDDQYIRDYLLYARGTIHPKLRDKDAAFITDMYAKLRRMLPLKAICPRFVEQVRSLSLLHAKLHLRDETRKEDVEFARETLLRSLSTSGYENAGLRVVEEDIGGSRKEVADFVRNEKDGAPADLVYRQFSEDLVKAMLKDGELFEMHGRLRVLE